MLPFMRGSTQPRLRVMQVHPVRAPAHAQNNREFTFPRSEPPHHPFRRDLIDIPVHDNIPGVPVEPVHQVIPEGILTCPGFPRRQFICFDCDVVPPSVPLRGHKVIQEMQVFPGAVMVSFRLADHMSDLRDVFQLVKTGFQQTKLILVFQYDTIKDSHERNSLMRPDIEIRSLQAGDRDGWENLVRDFRAWSGEGPPHSAEVYETTWRRLQEATEIHVLGAWTDRQLIGVAHYFFHPRIWGEKACYLTDLFVEEKMRGHGAGRALIEKVAQVAREHDAARYYWLTLEDNTEARVLYGKIARGTGFIRYQYPL
jgi:GNAT superfamily N-acetyltransferase